MKNRELKLTPRIHTFTQDVVDNPTLFTDRITGEEGTVNLVFPQVVSENFQKFKEVFLHHGLDHAVCFAHKPNKSSSIIAELARSGASIDVASYNELQHALNAGFPAERICAGGPKNSNYLLTCLQAGVCISVDSLNELRRIGELSNEHGRTAQRVLVRLNVESVLGLPKESRFGILKEQMGAVLELLRAYPRELNFQGFAFHINAEATKYRPKMFAKVLGYIVEFMKAGHVATKINVGGGFRVNYIAHQEEWNTFTSALVESTMNQENFLGWNHSGLGYWKENGVLRGKPQFPQMYQEETQFQELDHFLKTTLDEYNKTVKELLQDFMLQIMIEPGRALLDSAGMTVTRVIDVKQTSFGNNVVVLDMNRSQLDVFDQAYILDPILFSAQEHSKPFPTFLAGNLCMKSDLIYRHKTWLPTEPAVGDLIGFVNTAGYYMDFGESATLQQPLAPKYAVFNQNGEYSITDDTL